MSELRYKPTLENIAKAKLRIKDVVVETPSQYNHNLSTLFGANVLLKREDLQIVHSYKIRGAYNMISSLSDGERGAGVVCASAGNHAQGVAYACSRLQIQGKIFMPTTTPKQKVDQVKLFGEKWIEVILVGDTYDDANISAVEDCRLRSATFVPPFDDPLIIEGQATVAEEILRQVEDKLDYIFVPIGGGGLASGLASYFSYLSPDTKIIGVEPLGAPAMKRSFEEGKVVTLDKIDKFVDGAAVKRVGDVTFDICKDLIDDIVLVDEGEVCVNIRTLYNRDAMVVEPAGALSITALEHYKDKIKGKNVLCVVSGSNNDITRSQEIEERAAIYQELKHYFVLDLPQRAGALREFLVDVLTPSMDITHFEYSRKSYRSKGPAVIGIELKDKADKDLLFSRLDSFGLSYLYINDNLNMFHLLI